MKDEAIRVGVRELKNRLTSYLRLAKNDHEVIVTERGTPIAVIQPVRAAGGARSLQARISSLAARGEIRAAEKKMTRRIQRARVRGRPLSEDILADRR